MSVAIPNDHAKFDTTIPSFRQDHTGPREFWHAALPNSGRGKNVRKKRIACSGVRLFFCSTAWYVHRLFTTGRGPPSCTSGASSTYLRGGNLGHSLRGRRERTTRSTGIRSILIPQIMRKPFALRKHPVPNGIKFPWPKALKSKNPLRRQGFKNSPQSDGFSLRNLIAATRALSFATLRVAARSTEFDAWP